MYFTMSFMSLKSLESAVLITWADFSSLETRFSSPMCSTFAVQVPETTKLPEISWSPGCLVMLSCSPVMKDSLTSTIPSSSTESNMIWLPSFRTIVSPTWTSSTGVLTSLPFFRTIGGLSEMRRSLSTMRLARISFTMPIIVLRKAMLINNMFLKLPTEATMMARITLTRLNSVNVCFAIIFQTEFFCMSKL